MSCQPARQLSPQARFVASSNRGEIVWRSDLKSGLSAQYPRDRQLLRSDLRAGLPQQVPEHSPTPKFVVRGESTWWVFGASGGTIVAWASVRECQPSVTSIRPVKKPSASHHVTKRARRELPSIVIECASFANAP